MSEAIAPANRPAVVVGGGGAIGRAVCARLASLGHPVVAVDVRGGHDVIECDVTDEAAVGSAFAEVRERVGVPLVLVHAPGLTGQGGIEDEEPAAWRRILEVNLTSAYLCVREVVAGMRQAGWGRMVFVASVNGRFGGSRAVGSCVRDVEGWPADAVEVPRS